MPEIAVVAPLLVQQPMLVQAALALDLGDVALGASADPPFLDGFE